MVMIPRRAIARAQGTVPYIAVKVHLDGQNRQAVTGISSSTLFTVEAKDDELKASRYEI